MIATGIPDAHLYDLWPRLWPLLQPAYRRQKESLDLLAGVLSKELQIWAVFDKQILLAGIVTRLWRETTSGELHCRIWLVGGSRLSEWLPDFLPKLSDWARREGCTRLNACGRRGWDRLAPRYGWTRAGEEDGETLWECRL